MLTGIVSMSYSIVYLIVIGCLSSWLSPSNCLPSVYQDYDHTERFSQVRKIVGSLSLEGPPGERQSGRSKRETLSSTIQHDGLHRKRISLTVPIEGIEYVLDLHLNRDIISKGYFERTQHDNRTIINRPSYKEAEICYYHGKIHGVHDSWAAISTCDNIIRGAIFDGRQLHYIEPDPGQDEDRKHGQTRDKLSFNLLHLKHADFKQNLSCGHTHHHMHKVHPQMTDDLLEIPALPLEAKDFDIDRKTNPKFSSSLNRVKRGSSHDETRVPYNSNVKSRYVEMVIVVDNKKYKELGADLKTVRRRTKDIASIVNSLYAPLNIFVALVGIVVWTEADEIIIKPNGDDTLASFLHYRKERLLREHPNDNAQLLTAVEFENGVVGKAMQGPICSFKYSGGVNSDFKNNVIGIVATTVAHELGHNFGLSHDTENCSCSNHNNRCIMAASASSNRTMHWSSCSLKDFAYAFAHGMDYCLRNKPETLYDGPTCGNGFTEPGEECDCGLPEQCENQCCDASTCLMHFNATCASGTCCDIETCHVKSGGTLCREAAKLCDLPEYCTGDSEFCPEDVTKMDGLTCDTPSGQAYCYGGECRTHTDQCRLLWGPSGNISNDLCFQKNANGSRHAHCGYNLTTEKYDRCATEDVKCGILHCQMNSEKLEFGYESVAILASFFVNVANKIHPCRSVIVDFGLSDINPGMVPDGAKCGVDKMCVNQKCVAVGSVLGQKAPVCAYDCSHRGVCNSKGHCHCDNGYGGSYCEASGYGGSIDSGPARDPYGSSLFFRILYVTFFGFIPLIAIITFYIYYAGDYFKKLCHSIITLEIFSQNNGNSPSRRKPGAGGSAGGVRPTDISLPTQQNGDGHGHPNGPQSGEDFFGQYKGFSLSPIKSSPIPQRNGSATSNHATQAKQSNNNCDPPQPPVTTLPNGTIQSQTNANVYYSTAAPQTDVLLGNSDGRNPPGYRMGNAQTTNLQNYGNRSVTRVSWAQPIASPLPVSPPSEDESANSDTPLYDNENSGGVVTPRNLQGLQKLGKMSPSLQQKIRPMSSPPADETLVGKDLTDYGAPKAPKKEGVFGSTSALSKIAAAFPFVRSSFRLPSSSDDKKQTGSGSKLNKITNRSKEHLEISGPILQSDLKGAKFSSIVPKDGDMSQHYCNLPVTKSPLNRSEENLSPKKPGIGSKEIPKVQRAHSMIQPSNRNSIHKENPNYNSLRRPRPSVPPPKPPEAPPPVPLNPPSPVSTSFSDAKNKFLKSSTPPPVPLPNKPATVQSESPKVTRPAFPKFSFSDRSRSRSPLFSKPSILTKPSTTPDTAPILKAPIAKVEELNSPPATLKKDENIYDTIDEGMITMTLNESKVATPIKDPNSSSSSGASSPRPLRKSSKGEVETLSTGSAESNGGLLSEIIQEIQSRNKESIYNSVDRRKQKRKEAALKKAENSSSTLAQQKPSSKLLNERNLNKNEPLKITPPPPVINSLSSAPPYKPYQSPLNHNSFSFYKKPTIPLTPQLTDDKKSPASNLTKVSSPPVSSQLSSPALKSLATTPPSKPIKPAVIPTSTLPTTVAPSKPIAATTNGTKPVAPVNNHAMTKPTCAVSGVPKVTTSPSYVAKINYFSNLSQASNTPMKPINSIPAPSVGNPAKEIIYASSSEDLHDGDKKGGEKSHYAATIRRSRPAYYTQASLESDLNDANSNPVSNTNMTNKHGVTPPGKKSLGIYGSLGRKVKTPVIHGPLPKDRSREESPSPTPPFVAPKTVEVIEEVVENKKPLESDNSPQLGYKPFNPYLNRQLTFSTFRPTNNSATGNKTVGNNLSGTTTTGNASLNSTNSAQPRSTFGVNGVNKVQLRSPNRMVK